MQVGLLGQANLGMGQRGTGRNENLSAHHVDSGHHLGDGMLHLDTRVHFDKIVVSVFVDQEFHRTGVDIVDRLCNLHGVFIELVANLLRHAPGRGKFHDLLVAALQRAVALAEVADAAVLVGEDLHLYVLGLHKVFFYEYAVVAEGLAGLVGDELECGGDVLVLFAQPHPAPAASGGGLEDDGIAEFARQRERLLRALQRLARAGDDRHAALDGYFLGLELVPHLRQHAARRADELYARLLAGPRKGRVLAQKAVAGVDGVHAALFGQSDDFVYRQIRAQRAQVLADQIGLVRLRAEKAHRVLFGINSQRPQPQVVAGPEYADGYLAAVGGHHFFKGASLHRSLLV